MHWLVRVFFIAAYPCPQRARAHTRTTAAVRGERNAEERSAAQRATASNPSSSTPPPLQARRRHRAASRRRRGPCHSHRAGAAAAAAAAHLLGDGIDVGPAFGVEEPLALAHGHVMDAVEPFDPPERVHRHQDVADVRVDLVLHVALPRVFEQRRLAEEHELAVVGHVVARVRLMTLGERQDELLRLHAVARLHRRLALVVDAQDVALREEVGAGDRRILDPHVLAGLYASLLLLLRRLRHYAPPPERVGRGRTEHSPRGDAAACVAAGPKPPRSCTRASAVLLQNRTW